MSQIFAIGDIHGCSKTFKKLLLNTIKIQQADEIYCIGDYVDRGKDSKGVIDFIIELRNKGYNIHTLRGNHEQMMLDAALGDEYLSDWLKNGGAETLQSFGISRIEQLPGKYYSFLEHTKYFIAGNQYIFVHAGLNFAIKDPLTDYEAMLWTRQKYFDGTKINNKLLVHGHTPIPINYILQQGNSSIINIDGGCVYSEHDRLGYLVALSLPDKKFIVLRNID